MAVIRYMGRHATRSAVKSLLTITIAMLFVLAFGWMQKTMESGAKEIDRLYRTTIVTAEILQRNMSESTSAALAGEVIHKRTVDAILETGFIQSHYLEAVCGRMKLFAATTEGDTVTVIWDKLKRGTANYLVAANNMDTFFANAGQEITIEYEEGWDDSFFSALKTQYSLDSVIPIVIPLELVTQLRLAPGSTAVLSQVMGDYSVRQVTCHVVGYYTGQLLLNHAVSGILLPLRALAAIQENEIDYRIAEFIIDPNQNRELHLFQKQAEEIVTPSEAGWLRLAFYLNDQELQQVVVPMEKNLSLLTTLYPIVIGISILIAIGLALLLMMQNAREAAVIRVLGATRRRLGFMLYGEHIVLCLLGLVSGCAVHTIIHRAVSVPAAPLLLCAGLYFAGAILGSVVGAIAVANKKPLDLLQTKE